MSAANKHFQHLVEAGNPIGEVISVDRFLIRVKGLQPCNVHAIVMFETGSKGVVHQVNDDHVVVLHLGSENLTLGTVVVLQHHELVCKVGKDFIGRVTSVTGEPLDGKGPIAADAVWPVFNQAPPLHERKLVEDQLESGVTAIDALFPIVRGQRMAMLAEGKSGKSTLATQLTINQKNTDQVVVYCLIAKRRSDVDSLLTRLEQNGGLEKAVVVVSTMFESLITSYLAPYVACAMAEYLWQKGDLDTIIIYDDLTGHAHAYREIALLSGISPGRESYPGDMFHAHSSLLERAGRLAKSGKALTSIPIVHAANGDITSYLPTNIMSITDGQWILDMETFRSGIRPALNIGLSVTRAGGIGHNKRQKEFAARTMKILADYHQAAEFARFGTELAAEARKSLVTGKRIYEMLTQGPDQTFSLLAQQLMFDIILNLQDDADIDVNLLKALVAEYAAQITKPEDYEKVRDQLKAKCLIALAAPAPAAQPEAGATPAPQPQPAASQAAAEKAANTPDSDKGDKGKPPKKKRHLLGTKK